jgi:hypothetical protein
LTRTNVKVFNTLNDWFEEFRLYHRKDGKVVKEGDDLLAATLRRDDAALCRADLPEEAAGAVLSSQNLELYMMCHRPKADPNPHACSAFACCPQTTRDPRRAGKERRGPTVDGTRRPTVTWAGVVPRARGSSEAKRVTRDKTKF